MEKGIILGNRILDVVFLTWFIAQFYKVINSFFVEKKLNIKRFYETGGMPSSHASTVTSLTTLIGLKYGTNTPLFALSFVLSLIVMYDAAGIRRAAGRHAGILNKLLDKLAIKIGDKLYDEKLKELLGHSPIEVLMGAILGILMAFLFKNYVQI